MSSRSRQKFSAIPGIERLLELDGTAEGQKSTGYWVKILAHRVRQNAGRPYGIKYSLTLHSPEGVRVIGFDNAHSVAVNGGKKKRPIEKVPYDHRHYLDEVVPYEFRSGYQLLNDFFNEVERFLQEVGNEKKY